MKKKFALVAASAATIAMMAGPAALTVAAQDTDNDVRIETGWMKHEKSFKGEGHAWGRYKQLGEDVRTRGDEKRGDREDHRKDERAFKGLFKDLGNADLSATETAQIHDAIQVKQTSILNAMKDKMEARIEAMETNHEAVLEAWTIEDADEREAALEEIHDEAKEDREEIRTTFREAVKTAYETFTATLKSLLGLDD